MTELDRKAEKFVSLIVQAEAWNGFGPGVRATPEERAAALQSVVDAAGYFVYIAPWEPSTDLYSVVSGPDDIEVLLWLVGMLETMPRGKLEDEEQHVVDRIISSRKRRIEEEKLDTTDWETLEAAENQVHAITAERSSLWEILVNLLPSG